MAIQARSQTAQAGATGTLVGTPVVVHGLHYACTGTAGSVVLRDNGAGGTILATIDTPAAAEGGFVPFAPTGVEFATDCHVTLTNVTAVTIVYTDN